MDPENCEESGEDFVPLRLRDGKFKTPQEKKRLSLPIASETTD